MIKSIQQLREERIKEDTTKALLQRGRIPQPDEVSYLLAQNIYSQDLSKPFYQYDRVASNTDMSSGKYNKDIDNIEYDLSDLVEILSLYADKAEEVFNYFNIKKAKLEAQIADLNDRIDTIKLKAKYDIVKGTFVESFYSLTNLSTETTATIDIVNHTATIPTIKGQEKILALDETNTLLTVSSTDGLTAKSSGSGYKQSGSIYNILSANSSGWTYTVFSPIQTSTQVVLNISITTDESINYISLKPISVKPTTITLEGSSDGAIWNTIGTKVTSGNTSLTFYTTKPYTKYRIIFTKVEADKYSTVYSYIYGLESILFQYQEYLEEALVVTSQIEVPSYATKFALFEESDLPEGTSIYYYAKTSTDTIPLEISTEDNVVEYDIDNYSEEIKTFTFAENEAIEHTRRIDTASGVPLFLLGTVNNNVIPSSMILYRGLKCWKRASISSTVMRGATAFANSTFTYIPYSRIFEIEAGYSATANESLYYTANIIASQETTIETTIRCNTNYMLYVNKTKITNGTATKSISFTLNEGNNIIEILVFTAAAKTITLSFDPTEQESLITKVYGDTTALTYASLNDIIYNKHPNDRNLFTISDVNSSKSILLNSYDIGILYETEYKYIADDAEPYLDIRARLVKDLDIANNTPSLYKMKVRFV